MLVILLAVAVPLNATEESLGSKAAIHHLKRNEIDAARALLDSALKANPKDSDSWALMTFCSDQPLSCAERAVQLNKRSALALIALGLAKHQKDGQRSGVDELSKAIQLQPSALAFDARGRVLLNSGYYDPQQKEESLADFSKAIELDPKSIVSYLLRGDVYFEKGSTASDEKEQKDYIEKAVENYSEAIAIDPRCTDAYILRGRAYDWIHDAKSIGDFSKAIRLDPEQKNQGQLRSSKLVLFPEALPYIAETLGIASTVPNAYALRADAYKKAKQYDKAIADYTTLTKSQPPYVAAYKDRAEIYLELQDYAKAVADYTRYLDSLYEAKKEQKVPEDAWQKATAPPRSAALTGRAIARAGLKSAEATGDANKAIELIEKYSLFHLHAADPYALRAEYHINEKQFEKAIIDYTSALKFNPANPVYLINRASAFYQLGKYTDALADYNKAIELGSGGADLYMIRGKCYLESGDFEKALLDFNRAKLIQPDSDLIQGRFYRNRADLFSRRGEHRKAIDDLDKVLNLNRHNVDGYLLRAKEYCKINDYANAIKDYLTIAIVKPIWLSVCLLPVLLFVLIKSMWRKTGQAKVRG